MTQELRGCWQGHKSICETMQDDRSNRWQVYCGACGSSTGSYKTREEAITAWNTRPIEDALRAENARLREALLHISTGRLVKCNICDVYQCEPKGGFQTKYDLKLCPACQHEGFLMDCTPKEIAEKSLATKD